MSAIGTGLASDGIHAIYLASLAHAILFSKCHIFLGTLKSRTRNQKSFYFTVPQSSIKQTWFMKFPGKFVPRNGHICVLSSHHNVNFSKVGIFVCFTYCYNISTRRTVWPREDNKYLLVEYSEQVCLWPEPASLNKKSTFRSSLWGE